MATEANSETLLKVEGMTCHSCIRHVNDALREVDGVTAIEVRFNERHVLVRHDAAAAPAAFVTALREAGYESAPIGA